MLLAMVLLIPALAALWSIVNKLMGAALVHAPVPLTPTGLGALAVNFSCALLLVRYIAAGLACAMAAPSINGVERLFDP